MTAQAARTGGDWLDHWDPEDEAFWESRGKRIAWRTLWITTANLTMAFATWFVVSALVVRLPNVGFDLTTSQLFWLAAMPGLAGGTLRIVHTFLTPLFGTRKVVSYSSMLLLVPLIGLFVAVQDPATPFWVLMLLAFLAGLGGGNFSSFMPSTSLFFPKRLQGTALGLQAGIGNFGVSLVQFVTPWIIGFAAFGALAGDPLTLTSDGTSSDIWLQNATAVWIPIVAVLSVASWFLLRSVPVRANVREQMDIFRNPHTWWMTSLYMMTFGSFSGLAAAFPLLIREVYGAFEAAPDPLKFAFLGPLVGSVARVMAGPVSDRVGGGKVTHVAGIGMLGSTVGLLFFLRPDSLDEFPMFVGMMLALFFFAGVGNASTFKQMPMIFPPRQAGGVIGWTAAIAAYGPFLFSSVIGVVIATTGSPVGFFIGIAVFFALNIAINWWFYARKGAALPC